MEILTQLSWDPSTRFEDAKLINLAIFFKSNGTTKEFRGQLKRADAVISYLNLVYLKATEDYTGKKGENYVGKSVKRAPKKGIKIYRVPVVVTDEKKIQQLKKTLQCLQEKRFIVSRNEEVTHEEYCTFFGSSGGVWDIDKCEYPQGNFIETLKQTVYDMDEDPKVYQWTNVPREHLLDDWTKKDKKFAEFAKKNINPLVEKYWANRGGSVDEVKHRLTEIADVTEKYKNEFGIEGVK